MKKLLSAVAVAAVFSPAAFAQSSVTIYGILDLSVERLSNTAPNGTALYRMPGLSSTVPSRIGFRGTEDLGGGLRANFVLEQGFGVDNGTLGQGGRGFGRQAYVGLSGGWGALTLGRQYTQVFWANGDADVLGPNTHGLSTLDGYFPNARFDNSIVYRGTFSGVTVGAQYTLGRDAVNAGSAAGTNCGGELASDHKACTGYSYSLKYDAPAAAWGVAFAQDRSRGGPGAFAGLTNSGISDTRSLTNGYVKLGTVKVGAGWIARRNDGNPASKKSDLYYLGASIPLTGAWTLDTAVYSLKFKGTANKAELFAARASYAFSRRTITYISVGQINNNGTLAIPVSGGQPGGNPPAGGSQNGIGAGIRHSF